MAISIGDAILKVGVDTKPLDKGMKGIGASIKKHQKAIGIGMMAMGGAILAAGAMSIKTFAQMGDAVAKMAKRTGFSTEALSELKHAADISGASLETLEKGVKKMSKTIVDASDGLATYVRSFEKIGLTAEELLKLSPEEQFNKIAMAIAGLEDPTLRAAVAQEIFGRAGTQLLPLFAEGAEGIAKLRKEAHDLGIVFDAEAAVKAEEFTDAMTRMNEVISGVKMSIGEVLAPILTEFLEERVVPLVKELMVWIDENPKLIEGLMKLGGLLVAGGALLVGFSLFTKAINAAKAAMVLLRIATMSFILTPLGLALTGIALLATGFYLLAEQERKQVEATQEAIKSLEEHIETTNKSGRALLAQERQLKALNEQLLEETVILRDSKEQAFAWTGAVDGMSASMQRLNAALKVGISTQRAMVAAYGAAWVLPSGTPGRAEAIAAHLAGYPGMQQGGIVAQTGLALVHKGETVTPAGKPPTNIFHIYLDGTELENFISQRIVKEVRLQGGI